MADKPALEPEDFDPEEHADGCGIDFTENPDPDETAELRDLFPQGLDTPDLERQAKVYRALADLDE